LITDVWTLDDGEWRLQVRHAAAPPAANAGVAAQYGIVPAPPPTWDISGELSLVATGGNTSTRTLGVGGTVLHRTDVTRTRATAAFVTSEAEQITNARSLTLQGRHGLQVRPHVELFGTGALTRDRFAGISDRFTTEGGVAYTASLPRQHVLIGEGSIGFTVERRLDAMDLKFANATGSLRYALTLARATQVTEDASFTADLEETSNWRTISTSAVAMTLTQMLTLKASHAFEYRNAPVPGFGRIDMRTAAALVISWQRRPLPP
jgi:putative salt-induced outer membrane protein YdiY